MLQSALSNWHQSNSRTFPWRENITSYKIMVAEFMLHRTRAEQVISVFNRFISQYPDIVSLSNASEDNLKDIIKELGLHWRYKHFIESAKYILEHYRGVIPEIRKALLNIPGVGDYVAGAILTVCFNKKEYVIDSNIARFINRYYGLNLNGEIRRKKQIIEKAIELFNIEEPGKFLFAILDFTALVCTARKPFCQKCILKKECCFNKSGDLL